MAASAASAATTASAFEFLASADFLTQGVLATRRERLAAFNRLYTCQWTCQTVFQRALSPVAQNYCARMLCVTAPVRAGLVDQWAMPDEQSGDRHEQALWELQRLCVLLPGELLPSVHEEEVPDHQLPSRLTDSEAGIVMNPVFQKQLRAQLFSIASPLEDGACDWTHDDYVATERVSRARWKRVLWFILRCSSQKHHSLRLDSDKLVENVLFVRPIVPLLEEMNLIQATEDTKYFFEGMRERPTTVRKRVITGNDGDSDDSDDGGGGGAGGGYDEEYNADLRDKLQPPEGRVVNMPLQLVLPKGYEFLLMDTEQQMWFFVEQYLRLLRTMPERVAVLQLVFRLSYCVPGRQYAARNLNAAQTRALHKFSPVGITIVKSRKSQYFQVGVYGSNLLFGHDMEVGAIPFGSEERRQAEHHRVLQVAASAAAVEAGGGGGGGGPAGPGGGGGAAGAAALQWERDELISSRLQLLVETNFYVTAFVSDDPEIAEIEKDVLRLFMVLEVALPDAIICQIKPNETREAIRKGITAAQMQQFLERHAHVRMRQKALSNLEREFGDEAYGLDADADREMDAQYHAIPHNVIEQLHMWEQEESRLQDRPAALFKDCFGTVREFNRCLDFCREHQCLLWDSREKFIIVVDESHATAVTRFINGGT